MNIFKTVILSLAIMQTVGCAGTAAQKQQRFDGAGDLVLATANLIELDFVDATIYGVGGTAKLLLSFTGGAKQTEEHRMVPEEVTEEPVATE